MIYIDLSDHSIEVIQSKKQFLKGEKIIASIRREIPEGLVINGVIADPDRFVAYLKDIFTSGYPHNISDKMLALAISDKQIVHGRFLFEEAAKDVEATKLVIEEARKILPGEATEFEHFYKEVKLSQATQEVLYTAASRNTISHFAKIFEPLGIKLTFLSSKSFSLFELLKSAVGNEEYFLYCDVDKKIEYLCYDRYGPIAYLDKKFNAKTFILDTKDIIDKLKEQKNIKITKIVLGGISSIEIHASQLHENCQIPAVKMGEVIDAIIQKNKLNFDTGGTSYMLFANVLGLALLSKNKAAPNFARDLDIFQNTQPEIAKVHMTDYQEKDKDEKPMPEENKPPEVTPSVIVDQPTVKNKFSISGLIKSKIFIAIIAILVVAGIAIGLNSMKASGSLNLASFISSPTVTPTPSLTPTLTPTPTIDSNLKRSNIKVSVQNGTDKAGYAKEIASFLEEKGYKNVARGNADKSDYENTIIKIKTTAKNYLPLLQQDIKEKLNTPKVEVLDESDKYDIIIILGKS
jgi:hypothetical protein